MFVDAVNVKLIAGNGGNGIVAWRREKYIPKGGPYGGNGGNGGSVSIEACSQIYSLEEYNYKKILKAECGRPGQPNTRQGRTGRDLVIKVPCGTLIKDKISGQILGDLQNDKDSYSACTGGIGGKGNHVFKTATNRAPNKCTPGTEGEVLEVSLELKMMADIGFVGMPNAGKSTLFCHLTNGRAKAAPYPFTTLIPNLSYIEFDDYSRVRIADIPGIIADAHQNRGLGLSFLRHIERTKVLVFVLDAAAQDRRDPLSDFKVLLHEIKSYKESLADNPFVVALNKIDDPDAKEHLEAFYKECPIERENVFEISSLTGEGMKKFIHRFRTLAQRDGKTYY